jgi:hypothetical protein
MATQTIGTISVRSQRPETARVTIGTGSGGVSQLKNLTDVSITGAQDGYVLVYQANTNTYTFSPYIIDDGYF